jgi:hypothetical protein
MKAVLAASAFAILAGFAGSASAGPLGGSMDRLNGENLTTRVATFVCSRDDRGRHYMRGSNRVTCRPARPRGADWGWRCEGPRCGWWHRHNNRWHDAG